VNPLGRSYLKSDDTFYGINVIILRDTDSSLFICAKLIYNLYICEVKSPDKHYLKQI